MCHLDVRTALRRHLAGLHSGEQDTSIVEEMGIWSGAVQLAEQLNGLDIHEPERNLDNKISRGASVRLSCCNV